MADDAACRRIVCRLIPGSRKKEREPASPAGACRSAWKAVLDQEQLVAAA